MSKLQHVLQSFEIAKQNVIKELENNVALAGIHLEWEIKDRTPVKEAILQDSIITGDVEHVGTKITVEIWTNLDYAAHVEYWVTAKTKTWKVRKNPYDYYKWDRKFLTWTGAWMFRKSIDAEQETIKDIIKHLW